jgi:plastocyanin
VQASTKVRRIAIPGMFWCASFLYGSPAPGQLNTVNAHVEIKKKAGPQQVKEARPRPNLSEVVLWLKPLDQINSESLPDERSHKRPQLTQKNKTFQPHVLVVPVGSAVDFPNRDPFFHNVFSLFDGKRFDLGLYEAGATNSVRFDRLGVSFLFCNIHPEMSGVVIAVDTPYYGVSDGAGSITIADLPDGKYELHLWYERSLPEDLKALTKTVTVSGATKDLGAIVVLENPNFSPAHKNKYGQDYASPPSRPYSNP